MAQFIFLDEINKMGTTIVMVTHDITIVEEMKKRTIELDTGRILKDHPVGTFKGVSFKSKGVTKNESA